MSDEMMKREIKEAIVAGETALSSLRMAQDRLNSAKNWGLFDMFGGDFLAGVVKHSKMRDASYYMENAKQNLQIFQRELQDVNISLNLNMDIGGFLSFADFFFDGIVADWLVQSKINDAREQIADAIDRVERIMSDLRYRM